MEVDRTTMVLLGGLGTLRFGASLEEVAAYFGEPGIKQWEPEKYRFGHGFLFPETVIAGTFVEVGGRLVLYTLWSGMEWMDHKKKHDLQFRGKRLMGLGISKVCEHLEANGVHPIDGHSMDNHYCTVFTYGLAVYHNHGTVQAIDWSAHPGSKTPDAENSRWETEHDFEWSLAHAIR